MNQTCKPFWNTFNLINNRNSCYNKTYYAKAADFGIARIAENYPTAVINGEKKLHNLLSDGLLGMEDTDERISSNHKYLFGTDKNSSTYSSKAKSSFSSGNTLSSLTASGETARKP